AGKKMSPGSTVDLVISSGPSLIEISDLSRKSPEDATQILETLGFEYEILEEYSEDVNEGLVSHTTPGAGEIVTPEEVITIIVSLGLKAEVPNLIGYTYQEASNILQEIGLLPSASGDTGGRVSGQNPEEGSFLDPEGFVELSFDN
ncbi:MAG: PASTA domain-containing protein, partial [Candidatus Actinomarina sp.]